MFSRSRYVSTGLTECSRCSLIMTFPTNRWSLRSHTHPRGAERTAKTFSQAFPTNFRVWQKNSSQFDVWLITWIAVLKPFLIDWVLINAFSHQLISFIEIYIFLSAGKKFCFSRARCFFSYDLRFMVMKNVVGIVRGSWHSQGLMFDELWRVVRLLTLKFIKRL